MACKQCKTIWRERNNCHLTDNETATWLKLCGACVGADSSLAWIVFLSLRGSSRTGTQNACRELLEHKSLMAGAPKPLTECMYQAQMLVLHKYALFESTNAHMQQSSEHDISCHKVWLWNKNTDFRLQYFNRHVICLQDTCWIIKRRTACSLKYVVGDFQWQEELFP